MCRTRLFKVHFLMLGLLIVKVLSLLFRAIDYYWISVRAAAC